MNHPPNTCILAWSSWTLMDGPPDVSEIPPLLRRRMSPLARMSVEVGLACCQKAGVAPGEPRVVFASRHGEMGVTVDLLRQMAAAETLSPTGFSNSVHHAAVGYWSLVTENRQAMRAVASGEASFCYGFLDAIGMLGEADHSPVLLIAADDHVPPPFEEMARQGKASSAVALLIAPVQANEKKGVAFEMGTRLQTPETDAYGSTSPALDFLQWFLSDKTSLELVLSQRTWRWKK